MRILMLSQFFPPVIGGEERHVFSLSEALSQRGHEVMVATSPHPARGESEMFGKVEVRSLQGSMQRLSGLFLEQERPHAPPFPDPELTLRLHRLIRAWRPDVVHAHNWMVHSYLPIRPLHDVGFVCTLHDCSLVCAVKVMTRDGVWCEGPAIGRCLACAGRHYGAAKGAVTAAAHSIFSRVHRRAPDRHIVVSRAVAEWSGLAGGDVPFDIIPTFIPDEAGQAPSQHDRPEELPAGDFLLFVGDLSRIKGVHVLFDAYARLDRPPPLVMIGRRCPDTPPQIPDNVMHLGPRDYAFVMRAWRHCLFGLVPSASRDACPTVVMEAAAMGKTVIASRNGGLAELVEDGRTGVLVPTGDAGALAEALRALIADAPRRRAFEHAALAKSRDFRASSVVPRIEAVYAAVAPRTAKCAQDGERIGDQALAVLE